MSVERKPQLSQEEVREILLSDEDKQVLDNWSFIFNEISSYCKKRKINIGDLEFSGNLHDKDESDYYILLKVVNTTKSNEPEKITSFLFYSPDDEGTEGVLLEIGNIRADWKKGKADVFYNDVVPVNDDEYPTLSRLDVSIALREAVYFQSGINQNYNLPPRKQTDLLS